MVGVTCFELATCPENPTNAPDDRAPQTTFADDLLYAVFSWKKCFQWNASSEVNSEHPQAAWPVISLGNMASPKFFANHACLAENTPVCSLTFVMEFCTVHIGFLAKCATLMRCRLHHLVSRERLSQVKRPARFGQRGIIKPTKELLVSMDSRWSRDGGGIS